MIPIEVALDLYFIILRMFESSPPSAPSESPGFPKASATESSEGGQSSRANDVSPTPPSGLRDNHAQISCDPFPPGDFGSSL